MYVPCAYAVMLVWIMTISTEAQTIQPCPANCKCNETKHTMDCDGTGGVLTFVPRPPRYVTKFQLSNTNLGSITKEVMRNLTFCKMTYMRLIYNNITKISPDALSELKHLQGLYWKQGYLPISELGRAFQNLKCNISHAMIEGNTLDTETVLASSFQNMASLNTLSLHLKKMKTFNTSGLRHMKTLTVLDLGDNQLVDFSLEEKVPNLEILSLAQNDIVSIPSLCLTPSTALTPTLWYLIFKDTPIRNLNTSGVSCLEFLRKIDLSKTRIEHLSSNVFANLPALLVLNLSNLGSLTSIGDLAFNSTSLNKLTFKENPMLSTKKFNPKMLFVNTPNLSRLDMTSTKLDITTEDLKDLLLTLRNIEHLTLQRTHIQGLPVGVFSYLRKLTKLTLSGNYISGWNINVFANTTSIKHISFEGNYIQTINESSFPVEFRLSVTEINLSFNPFVCNCDLLWFRTWIKEVRANKSITFSNFPHLYKCKSPKVGYLVDYNPTVESCTIPQLYFVIMVIVSSICIVFTVAGLVTYRYRWYILYWISLMRRRRQRQGPPKEIQYDGFVSYSNPDWDWVSSELLDFLEGQVGMRLCEHSRDFKAGVYIVDNVIEAIETSRKTILVISNEYMKSDWCQFELNMTLSSFLNKEIDIVVILLEHIRSSHVTSSLRALMVSTTYIEWSDDQEARRLFRDRLQNALRE